MSEDCPAARHEGNSRQSTFRLITSVICSYLSQSGDDYLVLQMLEKLIIDQMVSRLILAKFAVFDYVRNRFFLFFLVGRWGAGWFGEGMVAN